MSDLNLDAIKEASVHDGADSPVVQHLSDEAKSSLGDCELPTGYLDETGTLFKDAMLREITGEEEDILTSKKMHVQMKMNKILENCVLSIGPHRQGSSEWSRILKSLTASDRLYLILKIRIVSLGAMFSFKVKCTSEECGKHSNQTVSLEEFMVRGLPNPKQRTWAGKLPRSGFEYHARVQSGFEEDVLSRQKDTESLMTMALAVRMVDLNGKAPVDLKTLKQLGVADRQYLRDDFEKHEGAIENEVDVMCPHCMHEFKVPIDIGDPSFFFPSSMRKS